jgi:antitoxin (DNA-binding transcriptional repressor) of toxin-antitoxin stability system
VKEKEHRFALCYTFSRDERQANMLHQVNYNDPKVRWRKLVDAALRGEKVIIAKDGKQMVELVPVTPGARRTFGSAKGKVKLAPDFDEPLDDFNEYTA